MAYETDFAESLRLAREALDELDLAYAKHQANPQFQRDFSDYIDLRLDNLVGHARIARRQWRVD